MLRRSLSFAKRNSNKRTEKSSVKQCSFTGTSAPISALLAATASTYEPNSTLSRSHLCLNSTIQPTNQSYRSYHQRQQCQSFSSLVVASSSAGASPLHLNSSLEQSRIFPYNKQYHGYRHHSQQIRTKVFVSQHNDMNITSNQILDYCANRGIYVDKARVTSSHVILQECPFCSNPTRGKADNSYKCYVQIGGGAYFCHRCGNGGSWFDFKSHLRGYQHNVASVGGSAGNHHASKLASSTATITSRGGAGKGVPTGAVPQPLPLPKQRLQAAYITSLMDSKDDNNNALPYLQETRGLKPATLRKYGVGRATYHFPSDNNGQYVAAECVTFPWIMSVADVTEQEALRGAEFKFSSSVPLDTDEKASKTKKEEEEEDDSVFVTRRIKVRALEEKSWQRLDPAGGGWGLFGFHTVPADATEIVLTEGEYDAMAVWQATGRYAVSLPNGCRSLPMEVLPMLEKFQKIYLWMDSDGPGQEGAKQFSQKIGINRCYIVQPLDGQTCKDANEALLKGLNLEAMVKAATVTKHENVLEFDSIRQDVIHEILHPDKYTGVPMPSLPMLTNLIKGFRRGELAILTGPTGSGKTTFLGQLSLDLAEQGVNVMWGSFEIKNTRLIQKLLQQYSRKPLPTGQPDAPAILHQLADRFSSLPMYFMKFHGGSDLEDVLDAMEYAVYVSDVEHIILDNLQFMISRNSLNKSFDKFDIQDIAIEKFRKFATDRNVHITLVVHPRKEDEASKLSLSSIYGSAKATQEADTVMILQSDNAAGRQRKYIEVKKNRYDGTLGYCPLHFDRLTARYDDTPK